MSSYDNADTNASILTIGEILTTTIGLPSIMQADLELIEEYIGNVFNNLFIEYDEMSCTCLLKLK